MKRIQFSISYPDRFDHPLHEQIMEHPSISRAELLLWSPTADATTLIWCNGDRDATERAISGIESLVVSHVVASTDGTYAYLHQDDYEFADVILDTMADSRVIFAPPVVFLDTGVVQFEVVGEATELRTFHDALSTLGDLTIDRVREFERTQSPSRLTDRQLEALLAADEAGYYEIPRQGTIEDIAETLECATSTAGELIRKAEAIVIDHYLEAR
jgi:hypothetical protein